MLKQRVEHFAALVLIGDGLIACLKPSREARAWKVGPEPWRSVMAAMAKRPQLTRLVGAVQVGVGIWWVLRAEKTFKQAGDFPT
jgi:uncharacterized protein YjeT (DUF2065 family)